MKRILENLARNAFRLQSLCRIAHVPRAAILLCLGAVVSDAAVDDAKAMTPTEQEMYSAPMPHQKVAGVGAVAKAHMVHLQGYLQGKPDNVTRLAQLKRDVQQCVAERSRDGYPSNPPSAWPDHLEGMRWDRYESANRSIHYAKGVGYAMNPTDCSLLENRRSVATLRSSKGVCNIDLLKKTARGACDANAHADAPIPPLRTPPDDAEWRAGLAALAKDPMRSGVAAALEKARSSTPGSTGARKTIVGLECEVFNNYAQIGGTLCFAKGGSFVSVLKALNPADGGLLLEMASTDGVQLKAVDAKFDVQVNAKVFAPYLDGGFNIKDTGARK